MRDRHYYRTMRSKELREEVLRGVDVDWQELAIVLSERLEKVEHGYCPRCDGDEE